MTNTDALVVSIRNMIRYYESESSYYRDSAIAAEEDGRQWDVGMFEAESSRLDLFAQDLRALLEAYDA